MSKLAVKLFEEREEKKENYLPLLNAVFGMNEYDPALNENPEFAEDVENALYALDQSGAFGLLQRYFVEEYFLQGKAKEEIGKEITAHMDLLLNDLEVSAIRFLRHPERAKPLLPYIRK